MILSTKLLTWFSTSLNDLLTSFFFFGYLLSSSKMGSNVILSSSNICSADISKYFQNCFVRFPAGSTDTFHALFLLAVGPVSPSWSLSWFQIINQILRSSSPSLSLIKDRKSRSFLSFRKTYTLCRADASVTATTAKLRMTWFVWSPLLCLFKMVLKCSSDNCMQWNRDHWKLIII